LMGRGISIFRMGLAKVFSEFLKGQRIKP
jgi:hypothetical protein